jgi:NAD(P)-dependent dehydrogenase (short-subunit alcohol dehydrogenase family)
MQLKGKVALVTGAGSGIGKAAAVLFGLEGAKVGLLGRSEDELVAAAREMNTGEETGLPLIADISKSDEMQSAVETLVEKWGRLDVVFANAGINGVWAPLDELTPEDWDQTLAINLKGTFLTVRYALPYLKKQGGSVIVTSSVNGTRMFSNTGATAYACSKAAQVAFTKMTAIELANYRVRINVICPGAIVTEIDENTEQRDLEDVRKPVEFPEGKIPLTDGKPGTSHQVAQLVLFLASDASNHITGTEVWIDGGQSLLQG